MKINERAPVIASGEIEVAADASIIWELMSSIDHWPEWNADVLSASLQGELAPGSKFIWRAGHTTITSTISQVDRPRILAWTGTTLGIKAIHVWRLVESGERVLVKTEESWDGLLPQLLRGSMQKMLKRSIDSWAEAAKGGSGAKSLSLRSSWKKLNTDQISIRLLFSR